MKEESSSSAKNSNVSILLSMAKLMKTKALRIVLEPLTKKMRIYEDIFNKQVILTVKSPNIKIELP